MLDGCSNIRFILTILMPLTKSGIGAMVVYTFINAWNMYMWPLLVNGSNEMRTVQIGISMLNSIDAQSITMMIAGVVSNNSVNIYFYNRTKAVDTWNVLRSCKRLRSLHYIFTSQKRKEQRRKRRKKR